MLCVVDLARVPRGMGLPNPPRRRHLQLPDLHGHVVGETEDVEVERARAIGVLRRHDVVPEVQGVFDIPFPLQRLSGLLRHDPVVAESLPGVAPGDVADPVGLMLRDLVEGLPGVQDGATVSPGPHLLGGRLRPVLDPLPDRDRRVGALDLVVSVDVHEHGIGETDRSGGIGDGETAGVRRAAAGNVRGRDRGHPGLAGLERRNFDRELSLGRLGHLGHLHSDVRQGRGVIRGGATSNSEHNKCEGNPH